MRRAERTLILRSLFRAHRCSMKMRDWMHAAMVLSHLLLAVSLFHSFKFKHLLSYVAIRFCGTNQGAVGAKNTQTHRDVISQPHCTKEILPFLSVLRLTENETATLHVKLRRLYHCNQSDQWRQCRWSCTCF